MSAAACPSCGWVHSLGDVVAVGRFDPDGPVGYKATLPQGAPLRASRAEAMRDVCEARMARLP